MSELIRREDVIRSLQSMMRNCFPEAEEELDAVVTTVRELSPVKTEQDDRFEYHYDHTDCIWYHDGKGRCPSTCSQYRDGWNDAMMYIFKGGPGYRPYRRNQRYEG